MNRHSFYFFIVVLITTSLCPGNTGSAGIPAEEDVVLNEHLQPLLGGVERTPTPPPSPTSERREYEPPPVRSVLPQEFSLSSEDCFVFTRGEPTALVSALASENATALYNLGRWYYLNLYYLRAAYFFASARNKGMDKVKPYEAQALLFLATALYKEEGGVTRDLERARHFFLCAARRDSVCAQQMLAWMCAQGEGGPIRHDHTCYWLSRAAMNGGKWALKAQTQSVCESLAYLQALSRESLGEETVPPYLKGKPDDSITRESHRAEGESQGEIAIISWNGSAPRAGAGGSP